MLLLNSLYCSEEINEDATPGHTVAQVRAHDEDTTHENSKVIYSITGGNDHNMFQISSSTGDLVLIKSLDREIMATYTLVIKVGILLYYWLSHIQVKYTLFTVKM